MTLQYKSVRVRVLRADEVTGVAGDTSLEHEGRTRISANQCVYFLLSLVFWKLEHGAVLKAGSAAVAQVFMEEAESGFRADFNYPLHRHG